MQRDKEIILSRIEWLNDKLLDAAKELIGEEIDTSLTFQSVLNSQKRESEPYHAVIKDHVLF